MKILCHTFTSAVANRVKEIISDLDICMHVVLSESMEIQLNVMRSIWVANLATNQPVSLAMESVT